MRTVLLVLLVFVALMNTTGLVLAGEHAVVGIACTPTDVDIQSDLYEAQFGGDPAVQWVNGVKTGTITFHCPIPVDVASPTHLELYYKNNTACLGCANDKVSVQYVKMNKTTGAITSVKTLDSTGGVNNGLYAAVSSTFTDMYNVSAYVYYLRLDLTRASGANNQKILIAVVY